MLPFNVWAQSLWETLYMVILSTAISYLIGLPLGLTLVVTDQERHPPDARAEHRSRHRHQYPALDPVPYPRGHDHPGHARHRRQGHRHHRDGRTADVRRRALCRAHGRILHQGGPVRRDRGGAVHGASPWQIVWKVLVPEAKPSLMVGGAISIVTILGYSAMAGFIGGGGLGTVAVNYGYNRYNFPIMLIAVIIIVVVVQIFQEVGMRLAHRLDKRNR